MSLSFYFSHRSASMDSLDSSLELFISKEKALQRSCAADGRFSRFAFRRQIYSMLCIPRSDAVDMISPIVRKQIEKNIR
jgi:hypothetical protein